MWGNKDKIFRSWRIERDLGPELEKQFSKKLGHVVCVILTSSFRRFLLTSLPVYSGAQFSPSSCFSLLLLSPGPHTAAIHSAYSIHFLFVCLFCFCCSLRQVLQATYKMINSVSLSKQKIVCYIAMSPVVTGLHFLPTHALSHDWWLKNSSRSVREISWKTAFKELI